jgi:hypothetical protein
VPLFSVVGNRAAANLGLPHRRDARLQCRPTPQFGQVGDGGVNQENQKKNSLETRGCFFVVPKADTKPSKKRKIKEDKSIDF